MKTIFYSTISLLVLSTATLKAQLTYHFPHTNATWGQFDGVYIDHPFSNDCYAGGTHFYSAGGDSSFNGYTYIRIYSTDSAGNILNFQLRFIREELDRVYYYLPFENMDTLLYDFSLQPGNEVHVYSDWQQGNWIVDSVNQIQVGNQMRKAIYLNDISGQAVFNSLNYFEADNTPVVWIEGMGSNDGLFVPFGGAEVIDGISFLTCFKENDSIKYGSVCDLLYLGIHELITANSPDIFPNPSSGKFTCSIPISVSLPATITVMNSLGEKVYENKGTNSRKINIDLTNESPGNYFLLLRNEEKLSTKMISVIK